MERPGRRFSRSWGYPWRQASMRGVWPSELRASSMPCTDLAAAWASRGDSNLPCLDAVSMMRSDMWSCPLAAGDHILLNANLPYVQPNIHRLQCASTSALRHGQACTGGPSRDQANQQRRAEERRHH